MDTAKAILRIARQASLENLRQIAVNARDVPIRVGRRPFDHFAISLEANLQVGRLVELVNRRLGAMRRTAGQHAVQKRTQAVNVPPNIGHRLQIGLLRRHVEHGPQRRRLLMRKARLPKICKSRLAILIEQDIGRLEIAMKDALLMRMKQTGRHVAKNLDRLGHRQRSGKQPLGQRTVFKVFHHVVRRLSIPTDGQELHDVPIGKQKRQLLDLAAQQGPIEPTTMGVELDRNTAARISLDGKPDLAIGPDAKTPFRIVTRDDGRWMPLVQADLARTTTLVAALRFGDIGAHRNSHDTRERGQATGRPGAIPPVFTASQYNTVSDLKLRARDGKYRVYPSKEHSAFPRTRCRRRILSATYTAMNHRSRQQDGRMRPHSEILPAATTIRKRIRRRRSSRRVRPRRTMNGNG